MSDQLTATDCLLISNNPLKTLTPPFDTINIIILQANYYCVVVPSVL